MYRIGVDVGGTNTDCAILDLSKLDTPSRGVLYSSKTPTTIDITSGIIHVVEDVLSKSQVEKGKVLSVTIGTTHFVNAVVEADERRLSKVAVVRLCGPSTRHIPPFTDYPLGLRRIMKGPIYYLDGGLEIDGREIVPLNVKEIEETARDIASQGITKVALVGIFSPLDHSGMHEERCMKIMLEVAPGLDVVCSHTIGGVGLLERENATILNASILAVAQKTVSGFKRAMRRLKLSCPLYLTQNDGTLTEADDGAKLPIKTFASGPTNSMTGAAFLAGLDRTRGDTSSQVLVVDIGGTTTDICALLPSGFPRQAPNFVEVGGVRTAFSMPDVLSVGLGGGSRVGVGETGKVTVGPDSIGHYLTTRALVFGGKITTSTDIVVASGKEKIGDTALASSIPGDVVKGARKEIKAILQRAVEDMKVSAAPVTVLLVGGGSIVYMDELEGVTKCIIPPHHDSANAVGAAISKVAGEVDAIEILDGRDEMAVVKSAEAKAIQAAIAKGADPEDVRIVEIEKIPLQYVSNKATRIRVKAIGKLKTPEAASALPSDEIGEEDEAVDGVAEVEKTSADPNSHKTMTKPSLEIDIENYRPEVRDRVWYLSEVDLEFIACGTGILGTGGGGPSYLAYLVALDALRAGGEKMRVISPESLGDDDLVVFGSWYGAPSVSGERLSAGTEIPAAIDALNKIMGVKEFHALLADEIGGGNGLATFPTSVHYDRPTVDGDMMGRAYPSMEHGTPYVYGHPIAPCAMADAKGNVSVVMGAESNARLEKMLRATCIELGLKTSVVARPLPGSVIKDFVVPNTVSQSWYLGRAVHLARRTKTSYVKAIFDVMPGRELFSGKVIDVRRDVSKGGYTVGRCLLAPLSDDEAENENTNVEKRHLVIPFQNEFLYAAYTDEKGQAETEVICTVPDLISVLGEDGEAIGSQELRYGLKVTVIGMPAHPLWTGDERGLKTGGPEYFGLDMKWKRIGEYQKPRSVIEEFR
ncbi:probable N-methylhydantoinase A/acetone carboxylase, beta subunit [Phialocephala subalpina]|uniref:Probable N-methylhydantoinase A/acetone carboxylase, beta subunit n=1 Tax=Phialocephala subalpina TaxID=576137 RepID=A0A1L7XYD7_9HELO|nr:probable N-methylhydantoinase A/acetone carboxylase, beta subunit [Phialocephala subalpina]